MGFAYYNEHDPKTAAWLVELIKQGHVADGVVDTRDIQTVWPDDLEGFTQCHFFAGIGGWSLALRLAGWSDDRPVWTGSCPCQPFSSAGKGKGANDDRHLWPYWGVLIAQCRPPVVFGEQVEAAIRHGWLDTVFGDLEAEGYACGASVLGAHSVQAPHIRQRVWFVAESECGATERRGYSVGATTGSVEGGPQERQRVWDDARDGESVSGMADRAGTRYTSAQRHLPEEEEVVSLSRPVCLLGHHHHPRPQGRRLGRDGANERAIGATGVVGELADSKDSIRRRAGIPPNSRWGSQETRGSSLGGFWSPCDWLPCRDGKSRPVEPGTFPLAHGVPARVGRLRGYGNAIVPQVAQAFIEAYLDVAG